MDTKYHILPPLKRFKLMQQRAPPGGKNQHFPTTPLCLPAKKRKESRESNAASTTICLPAKKRIWAFQPIDINESPCLPFDLNLDYKPSNNDDAESEQKRANENRGNSQSLETHVDVNDDGDEDDGIVCAVCGSTDGDPSDPIVFCDGCDLMVHSTCYGNPLVKGIPDGDWFCKQCLNSKSSQKDGNEENKERFSFSCCLCPVKDGAMKPTKDGRWAHIVCAVLVPEVFFEDPEGRDEIDCSKVPKRRWDAKCYVCESTSGCSINCSEPKCTLSFHVTCGLKEDLCIEYNEKRNKSAIVAGFCRKHTELWKKQQQTGKFKIVAREEHE